MTFFKSVIKAAERLINTPIDIEINTENVKVAVFDINKKEINDNDRMRIGVQLGKFTLL